HHQRTMARTMHPENISGSTARPFPAPIQHSMPSAYAPAHGGAVLPAPQRYAMCGYAPDRPPPDVDRTHPMAHTSAPTRRLTVRPLAPLHRSDASELLDGNIDDPAELAENFRDIQRVNRLLGGTSTVLRH